jgi:hypothetical protein
MVTAPMVIAIILASTLMPARASVLSTTGLVLDLDASNANSLASVNPTSWKNLVTGETFTIDQLANSPKYYTDTSVSSGAALSVNGSAGYGGAYYPPHAGSPINLSDTITLIAWIKLSSLRQGWNIIATRWFSDISGGNNSSYDWHYGIYYSASTTSGHYVQDLYTSSNNTAVFTAGNEAMGTTDLASKTNTWLEVGFTVTKAGAVNFILNGQVDPNTNSSNTYIHLASNTNYFIIGDDRSGTCLLCGMNGWISRVRMWNIALTPTQLLSDYRNEAASLGYGTMTVLSLVNPSPIYRAVDTITATVPLAGRISFYQMGKAIPGCKNLVVASSTAQCPWKPSLHGQVSVTAGYVPSDLNFISSSAQLNPSTRVRASKR